MGCGCKKKKDIARAARTRKARVVVVEGQVKDAPPRPPDVLSPPPRPDGDVNSIVNKLNDILKP